MRQIIFNADDFGFSPGITDGILACHRRGVLTSTTLMTTMPDCDRAIELARQTPTLGVGIHLCLTQGTPRAKTSQRGLTGRAHRFPRKIPRLLARLSLFPSALAQAEAEWAAQIEYALDRGLRPTHFDSHKHIHHWPALGKIAVRLAQRYGVGHIRCAEELRVPGVAMHGGYRALSLLARRLRRQLPPEITSTAWFFGLATTGSTAGEVLLKLIGASLPEGTGEVMVHPGDPAGITARDTRLLAERTLEMNAMLDPRVRQGLEAAGIGMTHYGKM